MKFESHFKQTWRLPIWFEGILEALEVIQDMTLLESLEK